jgi:hypothetical protein
VTDDELEQHLRRFDVSAPAPSLRARIVTGRPARPGSKDVVIGWGIAAAVAAAASISGWISLKESERRVEDAMRRLPVANEVAEAVGLLGGYERDVIQWDVLAGAIEERPVGLDSAEIAGDAPW